MIISVAKAKILDKTVETAHFPILEQVLFGSIYFILGAFFFSFLSRFRRGFHLIVTVTFKTPDNKCWGKAPTHASLFIQHVFVLRLFFCFVFLIRFVWQLIFGILLRPSFS